MSKAETIAAWLYSTWNGDWAPGKETAEQVPLKIIFCGVTISISRRRSEDIRIFNYKVQESTNL